MTYSKDDDDDGDDDNHDVTFFITMTMNNNRAGDEDNDVPQVFFKLLHNLIGDSQEVNGIVKKKKKKTAPQQLRTGRIHVCCVSPTLQSIINGYIMLGQRVMYNRGIKVPCGQSTLVSTNKTRRSHCRQTCAPPPVVPNSWVFNEHEHEIEFVSPLDQTCSTVICGSSTLDVDLKVSRCNLSLSGRVMIHLTLTYAVKGQGRIFSSSFPTTPVPSTRGNCFMLSSFFSWIVTSTTSAMKWNKTFRHVHVYFCVHMLRVSPDILLLCMWVTSLHSTSQWILTYVPFKTTRDFPVIYNDPFCVSGHWSHITVICDACILHSSITPHLLYHTDSSKSLCGGCSPTIPLCDFLHPLPRPSENNSLPPPSVYLNLQKENTHLTLA